MADTGTTNVDSNSPNDVKTELYIRDFCGKSINLITNYYYYNYYKQKDFNYKVSFKEKTLLDIIEKREKFMNYLISILPFLIFIVFAFVYIFAFISFWFCICCPIDCCKKNKIICKKKIYLILFHCFSIIIVILGILTLIYINLLKMDIHGMVCSLNLLIYNIKNGQGLIKKKEFEKPLWLNLDDLTILINQASSPLTTLIAPCNDFVAANIGPTPSLTDNFDILFETSKISLKIIDFENKLISIYNSYKNRNLFYNNLDTNTNTTPLYIKNLGPKDNRSTYLGKIYIEFNNNFVYSAHNYFKIIYGYCSILSGLNTLSYQNSLGNVSSFTNSLKDSLDSINKSIINKISKYINDYENILFIIYEIFLILFLFLIILINIVFFFYIKNNYKITRKCIIIFWVIVNFLIVILFIISSIFGIFSYIFNDVGDILDFLFSNENLSSDSPSLVGNSISAVKHCLTPNGDVLNEFLGENAEEVQKIIDLFNTLYNLKYKISNESNLYSSSIQNSKNTLFNMNNFISELDEYNNDIVSTTNLINNGNKAVESKFNELNKYTFNGPGTYQNPSCTNHFNDYWVSIFSRCPSSFENYCKLLIDPAPSYSGDCDNILITTDYSTVSQAASTLIGQLNTYISNNNALIGDIINEINDPTNGLEKIYNDALLLMKTSLEQSIVIIDKVYNVFYKYINNDPIENPDNYENPKVNVFSFLNCSSLGRDLNITIFIIKKKLTNNFLNVTIINYIMNFVTIFISILVVFILNIYKIDEENENIKINNSEKNILIKNIYSEKNEDSLNKINNFENNKLKIDDSNYEDNNDKNNNNDKFLMNKIDNNNLMNVVSNPINIEVNKNNDSLKNSNNNYLDKNSEKSKENEHLKENQNYNNDINNDSSF